MERESLSRSSANNRFVARRPMISRPEGRRKSARRYGLTAVALFILYIAHISTAQTLETSLPTSHKETTTTMARHPQEVWSVLENGHRMTLEVAAPHILRLRIATSENHQKDLSYAVTRKSWPRTHYQIKQEQGFVRVSTDRLIIDLRSAPFAMAVRDLGGRLLFETARRSVRFDGESITLNRKSSLEELTLGMGEVGETFDRTGKRYTLWNIDDFSRNPRQNFYCQIPFAIHLNPKNGRAFGLFIDNPGKQIWDMGHTSPSVFSYQTVTGDMELWLLFSDQLKEVLKDWCSLTGHMERPPLWALGYHQCRWSYFPEKRVREIAKEFRKRKIPCDAIYLDIDYMDGYRVFTWHPQRFPDPEGLIQDLAADGFHVVTIVDPGVKIDPQYPVYKDFVAREGFFCVDPETSQPFVGTVWPGEVHFPDFTRQDVQEAWGDYQKRALLDKGVAGIWNDMNEPHIFEAKEFPGRVLHDDFGRNSPHARIHQVYGLTMAAASHAGFVKALPEKRPFIITRSGWAGVQRYALMWTGDNQSTWASMTLDLQLNLSMGLSGIPFVGCDIGGFAHDCYPELYARWIEWGVFQPFCRTHTAAGTVDQEPWSFGPEVEAIARKMIELRMELLPYLYTAFVEASETGLPVNRPLVVAYPQDTNAQRLADEFLLGDALLIAPVLQPATDRRMVYLPADGWYHWWTKKLFSGPSFEIIEAPAGSPPLFAKAGSVIPMQESQQYVREKKIDTTKLEVFVGPSIEGSLVEDDGFTTAYRSGQERRISFAGAFDGKKLVFSVRTVKAGYASPRKQWLMNFYGIPEKPRCVQVDGHDHEFVWQQETCSLVVPDDRSERKIVVELP